MTSLPSWARKGVRVVCINANFAGCPPVTVADPQQGQVYTIRRVSMSAWDDEPGILLSEITNGVVTHDDGTVVWNGEPRYRLSRFRPAVPTKTEADDLALFTPHLTATPPVSATRRERADV